MSQHVINDPGARPTTVMCPRCEKDVIVYNGNFFCNSGGYFIMIDGQLYWTEAVCEWALGSPPTDPLSRKAVRDLRAAGVTVQC